MKVLHHNDADGRCSAAIVFGWVGIKNMEHSIEYIEMDYAKPVPLDRIAPGEQVWVVDFSLKLDDMDALLAVTDDVTWIDHHKTAIDLYAGYPKKIAGFRKDGVAGCVLTWQYVHWYSGRGSQAVLVGVDIEAHQNTVIPVPRSVVLLGDYDTWAKRYKESNDFYEGLKLQDQNVETGCWFEIMCDDARCAPIIEAGKTSVVYRNNYCADMCASYGFESELDGIRCWVTNIFKFGSLGFGQRMKEYPFCAACVFDGAKWTVSLYSDTGTDVAEICKRHGGGGHKGAAGFVTEEFPFVRKYK